MNSLSLSVRSLLNHPNVIIKDVDKVSEKLKGLFKSGSQTLHIISDFDMTLTKYWMDGERNHSSHSVLASTDAISTEFKEAEKRLCQEYYPYEISTTISHQEKTEKMVEWWTKCNEIYIKEGLSRQKIRDIASHTKISYREGLEEFIQLTETKEIPLLVFSAGLKDIIEELLDSKKLLKPHMHVVSNSMIFSEEPPHHCIAFKEPLIHVLNKGEVALKNTPFYDMVVSRPNVILMGDSLGDIHMSGGLEHDILLTVGFLNYNLDELLPVYQQTFDIVITHDASLQWINTLLKNLTL